MAGQRQPIELVMAKGKKHLTKEEIKKRALQEIQPLTGEFVPPTYLTKKQKDEFHKIASQLNELKIMSVTDVDALARYITANDFYITAVKQMRKKEVRSDPLLLKAWSELQERYFKQCRGAASDLGLTISSRCKLVIPEPQEPKRENKFAKFEKRILSG